MNHGDNGWHLSQKHYALGKAELARPSMKFLLFYIFQGTHRECTAPFFTLSVGTLEYVK